MARMPLSTARRWGVESPLSAMILSAGSFGLPAEWRATPERAAKILVYASARSRSAVAESAASLPSSIVAPIASKMNESGADTTTDTAWAFSSGDYRWVRCEISAV